ncbi:cyclophilin-like fold protein [Mycobacterium sp. DBP42]|uniref:cyclophilin-like fold protein n=1 Tax=Mycobacterium sp. DBP42 TaxID=2545267 RepID=UPI00110CA6C3|nr:cyclophilin-like fold protein [Mycobacterium sp. DBP42]TMS51143.1 hypothetical protein E0T84_20645 [Mycobacterium sp. DBP42]
MTTHRCQLTVTALVLALTMSGCTHDSGGATAGIAAETSPISATVRGQTTTRDESQEDEVTGTAVHFTTGSTVVEVTINEDTPTTRDFLAMLPITLTFEDFNRMEKIAYPPRGFDTTGNTGMTPKVGDLFSYIPWSNLGFFYNTGSLGFSEQLVRIGTTDDLDAVMRLDGQQVTITVASR